MRAINVYIKTYPKDIKVYEFSGFITTGNLEISPPQTLTDD